MKKLLALLLALFMVFSLIACGEPTDKDDEKDDEPGTVDTNKPNDEPDDGEEVSIIGTWEGTNILTAEDLGIDVDGSYEVDFELEFKKNGTCILTMDEDDLADAIIECTVEMLYDMFGSKAEADEAIEAEYGMDCREYAEEYTAEYMEEVETQEECAYTHKTGVLDLDGETLDCKLSSDRMKLTGTCQWLDMDDETMTLKKVSGGSSDDKPDEPDEPVVKPDDKEDASIVGVWKGTMEFSGEDMGIDVDGTYDVAVQIEFEKDGTLVTSYDPDDMADAIIELTVEMLYQELGGKAEADKVMEETYGMDCREYAETYTAEYMDSIETVEESDYTYEDGVLIVDGEETEHELSRNTLTIVEDGMSVTLERA